MTEFIREHELILDSLRAVLGPVNFSHLMHNYLKQETAPSHPPPTTD